MNKDANNAVSRRWKKSDKERLGGWAKGNYLCTCRTCGDGFIGDKRAWTCADCAYENNKVN